MIISLIGTLIILYVIPGIWMNEYITNQMKHTNWIIVLLWPLFAIGVLFARIFKDLREIYELIFWRKEKCVSCEYLKSVSNHSPCHECIRGNKYKRYDPKPVIEILKEAGFEPVDMEGKYETTK